MKKLSFTKNLMNLLMIITIVVILVPLFWMFLGGFKTDALLFSNPWKLPESFSLDNYINAWNLCIGGNMFNSIIYTVISTFIVVIVSAIAAFATLRFKFKLKMQYFLIIIAGMMVAPQSSLIPIYKLLINLNIYDTRLGLILPYIAFRIPFSYFLMWTFISRLPIDVEESAYLEGASILTIFLRIVLPMSKTALVTTAIMSARFIWNDFVFALVFTEDSGLKNIPLGLFALRSTTNTNWTLLLAGLGLSSIPMLIIYFGMQKYFVNDANAGAVKG